MWDLEAVGAGSSISRVICVPSGSVKICGNPDESRWNSLDPSGCSLAKVAGAEALARQFSLGGENSARSFYLFFNQSSRPSTIGSLLHHIKIRVHFNNNRIFIISVPYSESCLLLFSGLYLYKIIYSSKVEFSKVFSSRQSVLKLANTQ